MSAVAPRLMTAEEFWQSPLNTKHAELIRGEVVEHMPPSKEHGRVALAIGTLLRLWNKQGAGGEVGVESGFILGRDPDTICGPDVHYLSAARVQSDDKPEAFWTIAPDLALEVISPGETAEDVREKVRDFLSAGTPLVWLIYPRTRELVAHTPDGLARTFGENDTLEHAQVLPGFSCKVSELFD